MTFPLKIRRLTPVRIIERLEPALAFRTQRFGFAKTREVMGDDGVPMFASLENNGIDVMYPSRARVAAERPHAAGDLDGHSIIVFIDVDSIDTPAAALSGTRIVKPRHRTFHGSGEIHVREPGGNVVAFAQFGHA